MNTEKLIDEIVIWLKSQVAKTHANGLLVGVSGGIDSSVVSHLIKKACPENSLGVIIPINSSEATLFDAKKLVEHCKIRYITVDISKEHSLMLDKVINQMEKANIYNDKYKKITDANLRARLRMSTLYAIANNINYLVVGTDNKDETYTGYFTKYGDGAVDILPIANIFKSQVYEMAKFLNIPSSIISKPPSADLWENQTDEDEMGVKYKEIENYILGNPVDEKSKNIIEKLHHNSIHKRTMPPKFEF